MQQTLTFLQFLKLNAPANLALLFLAGVFVGMAVWQWSKKLFIIAVGLAFLFAGGKLPRLQHAWPFSIWNRDKITNTISQQTDQVVGGIIKQQADQALEGSHAPTP